MWLRQLSPRLWDVLNSARNFRMVEGIHQILIQMVHCLQYRACLSLLWLRRLVQMRGALSDVWRVLFDMFGVWADGMFCQYQEYYVIQYWFALRPHGRGSPCKPMMEQGFFLQQWYASIDQYISKPNIRSIFLNCAQTFLIKTPCCWESSCFITYIQYPFLVNRITSTMKNSLNQSSGVPNETLNRCGACFIRWQVLHRILYLHKYSLALHYPSAALKFLKYWRVYRQMVYISAYIHKIIGTCWRISWPESDLPNGLTHAGYLNEPLCNE